MSSDSESDFSDLSDEEDFSEDSDASEWSGSEVESDDDIYYSFPPAKQPKLSSQNIQKDWVWKDEDNVPQIKQFTASPGVKNPVLHRLGNDPSALKVLCEVFGQEFWKSLTEETNRYAEQIIQENTKTKKIDAEWFPVSVDEMKAYVALSILMTQVKKSTVQMNWSKREIIHTPIYAQTMPYRRFLSITRFLHFANNESIF